MAVMSPLKPCVAVTTLKYDFALLVAFPAVNHCRGMTGWQERRDPDTLLAGSFRKSGPALN